MITILHDPIKYEDGGFKKGAEIKQDELFFGLTNKSFATGTLLHCPTGANGTCSSRRFDAGTYRVEGMNDRQYLVKV